MMGLGMMIGAGVFLGIGNAVAVAGPGGVLLTFTFNGLIALFTAFSYAELSSAVPRAGGAYNFARLAFGRGTSFIAGWMEWFASSVAGSLYAVTFAIYTVRYLETLHLIDWLPISTRLTEKTVAFLIACLFLYINYRGASEAGRIGAILTLGQTLFLVFIGVLGAVKAAFHPELLANLNPFLPMGWSKVLITMGFTYVAFEGYEVIAQAGDETIDPKQNLPKAMIYSVFIVTLTYVAVAFASLMAVKTGTSGVTGPVWEWIGSFREKGFGEAISRLMPYGNFFLTLAVIFASVSALNATIYSATRASYALGRDRLLPRFFAAISARQKTPWVALLFTGIVVVIVAVGLPIIAIICQGVLAVWLVHMSLIAWIVAPVWVTAGLLIYRFYARLHVSPGAEEIRVLEEEPAADTGRYKIMLAVANMDNALKMIRPTYLISETKKASVNLIHMVQVPEQVPLTDAEEFMMKGREGILEAMMYFVMNFPITTTIRYCRNIARGILGAVKEKKIDLLVLGWHGLAGGGSFILGSTVDLLLERSPSRVLVMKGIENQKFKKILVPWGGGPHRFFALEIATILAQKDDSEICVLGIRTRDKGPGNQNLFKDLPRQSACALSTKEVCARDAAQAILEESEKHDLLILGSTRDPLIYQATRESISHRVARRCGRPLMIVKSSGKWRAWMKRWI